MNPALTLELLLDEAATFSEAESQHKEPLLYGVTDGKAVGTYLEHKFIDYLKLKYSFSEGRSAFGIDLPVLQVDIKVTSIRQPQSSSPFKSGRQKIYGLDHHFLVFVYEKTDDAATRTGRLDMQHTVFIDRSRTADYQMTTGLLQIEVEAHAIAEELLRNPPEQGYLTISNALQWRLQYRRVLAQAGLVSGLTRVR